MATKRKTKAKAPAVEPNPGGRPTKYRADFVRQVKSLAQLGATDREIAEFLQIDVATLYRWKLEHSKFCDAIKMAKVPANDRVERSLFNRAVGYSFESEKIFCQEGLVTRVPIVEHVPPDTTAQIFFLKNRLREQYKDRHEIGTAPGEPIEILDPRPPAELVGPYFERLAKLAAERRAHTAADRGVVRTRNNQEQDEETPDPKGTGKIR